MHVIGIHLDFPYFKGAVVFKGRQGIEVKMLKTATVSETENVKQLYIQLVQAAKSSFFNQAFSLFSGKIFNGWVASSLSAKDVLIRSLALKMAVNRHIEEAIAFQSETTTHFNPLDILTVSLLEKRKESTEALLFTTPRELLHEHLKFLAKFQIEPDSVSTHSSALCHFIRWKYPELQNALIVDIGSSETTCAVLENGRLKKAHSIPIGAENLLSALFEDRKKILLKKEIETSAKQIDLLLLKPHFNPHLSSKLKELKQELLKVQYRFLKESQPILFTGRLDPFIHLREYLIDSYEDRFPIPTDEQKFAIPIGSAIEQTTTQAVQFLREEFLPQKNKRKMGVFGLSLFGTSIAISLLYFFLGFSFSQSQKKKMLNQISLKNKAETIDEWISAVEKNNREYPYILQAPKVAEVLLWLSEHPLLNTLKNEGDPIDLQEIHYQLVNFPKIGATKEPYLAKVELEFQFKSAMSARKFHEALRQGDEKVNPLLEITWEPLNEGYRATFYLKNRSQHVF